MKEFERQHLDYYRQPLLFDEEGNPTPEALPLGKSGPIDEEEMREDVSPYAEQTGGEFTYRRSNLSAESARALACQGLGGRAVRREADHLADRLHDGTYTTTPPLSEEQRLQGHAAYLRAREELARRYAEKLYAEEAAQPPKDASLGFSRYGSDHIPAAARIIARRERNTRNRATMYRQH